MKRALSISFGGELVEAVNCDYQSYKKYGLVCPECRHSVFLVRPSSNTKKESYFSHFKQNKVDPRNCELRVKNYHQLELAQIANQARGQRSNLFRKWLWKLVWDQKISTDGSSLGQIIVPFWELYKKPELKKLFDRVYEATARELKEHVTDYVDLFISSLESGEFEVLEGGAEVVARDLHLLIENLACNLDLEFHRKICIEAMLFVLSSRNRPNLTASIFNSIIYLSTVEGEDMMTGFKTTSEVTAMHAHGITTAICAVPWAIEFAKINQAKEEKS